jgi:hypothetical protein
MMTAILFTAAATPYEVALVPDNVQLDSFLFW